MKIGNPYFNGRSPYYDYVDRLPERDDRPYQNKPKPSTSAYRLGFFHGQEKGRRGPGCGYTSDPPKGFTPTEAADYKAGYYSGLNSDYS